MPSIPTIAVLPFVNLSSAAEHAYFSDGITEEIIHALARIESLKVISRTSSFYFKGKSIPLGTIAEQLNASIILEGSVRFAGQQVRITAQLIRAEDDSHFWSETWDRQLDNIFAVQDEISLLIADKLREQFGHLEIQDHLVEKQTDHVDAYALALKARFHFLKWNPTEVQTAVELYRQALAVDPNHTESHIGLADALGFLGTTGFLPRTEAWDLALVHAKRALALNPRNPGVHYQLANYSFFVDFDFAAAVRQNTRALELQPNYPEARQFMAFLHMVTNDLPSARIHIDAVLALDPLNQETLFYHSHYLYRQGKYEQALQQLEASLEINPMNIPALVVRRYCLLKLGRYADALAAVDEVPPEIAIPDEQTGTRCLAYLMMGDQANADVLMAQLEMAAEHPEAFQAHTYLFYAHTLAGEWDEAFAWVERAIAMKSTIYLLAYTDPLAESLQKDPRYETFFRQFYPTLPTSSPRPTTKAPLLDAASSESFAQRLNQFIQDQHPYLNPDISLRSLAAQIELHPNQLSWLLNERMGQNFNAFINHFRVEHFKQLALDPANSHISLIGLAYESGFNSKTVFNTYFKKAVGMTPSAFVKQHSA